MRANPISASTPPEASSAAKPAPRRGSWGFLLFMLVLAILFAGLGYWQMQRLEQKEAMIAAVDERLSLPPEALPPVESWPSLSTDRYDFRPVSFEGAYQGDQTILVFTSLSNTKGQYQGTGYWVVVPVQLTGGGTVFVNRGFVPEAAASSMRRARAAP